MSDQLETSVAGGPNVTTAKILAWMQEWTEANHLTMTNELDQKCAEAGFDSMHSVELAFFLEERLKIKIDDTVLFDYPTFTSLAEHLLSRVDPEKAGQPIDAAVSGSPSASAGTW